jgi:glycosyltransferase involved in cell wall biosynthesis
MGSSVQAAPRKRVIWLQNSADHYFVQMLDALNSQGDVEYFGVFLCPPPQGNVLHQVPKISPHVFLGEPAKPGNTGTPSHKTLGASARKFIEKLEFSAAIVGGYDSRFKRWVLRYCKSRGIHTAMFADSNIRAERGRSLKKRLKRFAKRFFLHRIIQQVDTVIPCNRCGVAYWRYYGCPAKKITRSTYYCAVDVPAALAVNRVELFARYRLDPDCKLIFTAARLVPAKALHLMVEAFSKSGLADQGWIWAVAGDGPLRQELESQVAEQSRRAGTIRFLGAVAPADIPPLMAQSELFVLPSIYEPHGIVVTEAMAVGTPVIASRDCGAARDLVRNGKTGWLFQSGDTTKLTDILLAAVRSESAQAEKSRGCKARFIAWYARYGPLTVVPALAGKIKRGA